MMRTGDRTILGGKAAACLGVTLAAVMPSGIAAQTPSPGASVADRSQPEYRQEPIRVGGFELYPTIETEVEYNDNIFAADINKRDDVIVSVSPAITVRDRRPDRELFARARAGVETYADGTYNTQAFGSLEGRARFGLGTLTRPFAGFEVRRNTTQRRNDDDDFRYIGQPIEVTTLRGNAGLERDFGPVTAEVEGRANRTRFDGSIVIANIAYDADFRDYDSYSGSVQLSYSRSGDQRIYVSLDVNEQDFGAPPAGPGLPAVLLLDRSSHGYRAEIGMSRQVTELLLLDGRIGYLRQIYDDPTIPTVSGLSFQASALYNPTPLTSLRVTALRAVDNTSNPLLAGLVRTEFSARVDHELLRNLIVSGNARYALIDRGDVLGDLDEWSAGASLEYFLDRHWSATARTEHFERSGLFAFSQNRFSIGLRYRF